MYQEWKNDILLSDILSNVDGDKYSIIGEGIYERQFEAGRLGGGLKHTQSWTDNTYLLERVRTNQDETVGDVSLYGIQRTCQEVELYRRNRCLPLMAQARR